MTTVARDVPRRRKVAGPMTAVTTRAVGVSNIALGAVSFMALVAAYGLAERLVTAQEHVGDGRIATVTASWWGPDLSVSLNMSLLLVGAAAGVVGSAIQQSIVFAQRAGQRTLQQGFVWWYALRPVWSALLGAIAVLTFNAGLISIGDQTTSAAGVTVLVTMGCLAGLFTDRMLQRLAPLLGATAPHQAAGETDTVDADPQL
ncbi:MAG: hypothetical protein QOF53_3618 [Nocardioidaceae bacterium]|jgi:hypothetical protein|nr:hypothetical protein [Nocardioidaceae bacterium]